MKNLTKFAFFAALCGVFAGCGSDSGSNSGSGELPESIKNFSDIADYECNEARQCAKLYAEDVDDTLQCVNGEWETLISSMKNACADSEILGDVSSSSLNASSSSHSELVSESTSSSSSENVDPESSQGDESSSSESSNSSSSAGVSKPDTTITETCTEVGACDAMDKADVSTWHFTREDSFGDDAEYTYSVSGKDLIVTIKNADGTSSSKTYSMYNMESEVGVEMAFSAAKSTCEDGNGNDNTTKVCVRDTVIVGSSSSSMKTAWDYLNPNISYGEMTDSRDGQIYKTVTIGEQTWMAENLNYAYNAPTSTEDSSSFCYENEPDSCAKYGRLYLWSTAMDSAAVFSDDGKGCGYKVTCSATEPVRGVCPEGWHLPSEDEWSTLFTAVGGTSSAVTALKSTSGWYSGNGEDSFGFSLLPAGCRYYYGGFDGAVTDASPWSSTEYDSGGVYYWDFNCYDAYVGEYDDYKSYAYSVRCVKD